MPEMQKRRAAKNVLEWHTAKNENQTLRERDTPVRLKELLAKLCGTIFTTVTGKCL